MNLLMSIHILLLSILLMITTKKYHETKEKLSDLENKEWNLKIQKEALEDLLKQKEEREKFINKFYKKEKFDEIVELMKGIIYKFNQNELIVKSEDMAMAKRGEIYIEDDILSLNKKVKLILPENKLKE